MKKSKLLLVPLLSLSLMACDVKDPVVSYENYYEGKIKEILQEEYIDHDDVKYSYNFMDGELYKNVYYWEIDGLTDVYKTDLQLLEYHDDKVMFHHEARIYLITENNKIYTKEL